jgi:phage/plasmid-associated DNA primase
MIYKIWSVKNYSIKKDEFENLIKNKSIEFDDIEDLCDELKNDNSYHFRIIKKNRYIFFCDIDGYKEGIKNFMTIFFEFIKKRYNLEKQEYLYTENSDKNGSYHISIPNWNTTTEKLKEIITKFKDEKKNDINFNFNIDGIKKKVIDTSIYSDHWFRCPNQSKGDKTKGIHIIKKGKIVDFVIDHIPKSSMPIDNYQYNEDKKEKIKENILSDNIKDKISENILSDKIKNKKEEKNKENNIKIKEKRIEIIKKFLSFYTDEYYDDYNIWYKIGMGLKKIGIKYDYDFKEDYKFFSQKSQKYNENDFNKYWNNFNVNKITVNEGTLYKYARDCNIGDYKKIMKELYEIDKIEITEKYIVEMLKEIAGNYFIYVNNNLYCFNVRNKLWYIGDITMKKYINDELYDYLFNLLTDSIIDEITYKKQLKELKNYCLKVKGQEILCKAYEIRNKNETHIKINFNENKYLFGFTNGVYDLKIKKFRNYKYDDYITLHTGYEYEKGNKEEKEELLKIISQIMPDNEKRYLLLQILSTGLIGSAYQNLFIFNGSGGNGKSSITKLMKLLLGNYYYKLDSKYLLETSKQGANPELANLSYKRYVNSSEPASSKKIQNSIYKELTGDREIQARKCNSNETKVKIDASFILECNKRPLLEEEPTEADARRIIDLLFNSKFTLDENEINEKENIYRANKKYEDEEHLDKLKYSFFEILVDYAHRFLVEENESFKIPFSVKERSQEYLNSSYQYLQYLKEITIKTDNEENFISIGDLFKKIKISNLYINSLKQEKRKINLRNMCDFFSANTLTKKNYRSLYRPYINGVQKCYSNVLLGYVFIKDEEIDDL